MNTLDQLLSYLELRGVAYTHDIHPLAYTAREVADAEHVPPRAFAKTVVLHTGSGFVMAVLPATRRVDLEELREALGLDRLRLATEHELAELFPSSELGAMPPLGNGALYDMPVFVHSTLLAEDTIAFNAGTHRDVIRISVRDWMKLVKPTVLAFAYAAAR